MKPTIGIRKPSGNRGTHKSSIFFETGCSTRKNIIVYFSCPHDYGNPHIFNQQPLTKVTNAAPYGAFVDVRQRQGYGNISGQVTGQWYVNGMLTHLC